MDILVGTCETLEEARTFAQYQANLLQCPMQVLKIAHKYDWGRQCENVPGIEVLEIVEPGTK